MPRRHGNVHEGEQEISGLPQLIHGAIQVVPVALPLAGRLVHAPAEPHRAYTPMERLLALPRLCP
jgi:hypothetical protein